METSFDKLFDSIKYVELVKFDEIRQKEDNWARAYSVQYKPITFDGSIISKLMEGE